MCGVVNGGGVMSTGLECTSGFLADFIYYSNVGQYFFHGYQNPDAKYDALGCLL